MAIITRSTPTTSTIRSVTTETTTTTSSSVQTTIQPTRIRDMGDANFGTLDASQDGKYVVFDNTSNNFKLLSADELLVSSVSDGDLPDTFVDQVEREIDITAVSDGNLDGGLF